MKHAEVRWANGVAWRALVIALGGLPILGACGESDTRDGNDAGEPDAGEQDAGERDASEQDAGEDEDHGTNGTGGTAGSFDRSIEIDGVERGFALHVPDSAMAAMEEGPIPLLLVLHPMGFTGRDYIERRDLTGTADANGFLLAAPEGYGSTWMGAWPRLDGTGNSIYNDQDLTTAVVETIGDEYDVHTKRIYACGSSAGASFLTVLLVVSNNPDVAALDGEADLSFDSPFAAVGTNAGQNIDFGPGFDYANANPKSAVWINHGTADVVFPYTAAEALAADLEAAGFPVRLTLVDGGEHRWLFDNQELWDFFARNPLP